MKTGIGASGFLEVSPIIFLSDFDTSKPSGHVVNILNDIRYEDSWRRIAEINDKCKKARDK